MPDAEVIEPEPCAAGCGRDAAGWPAGPLAEDGELCEDCHDEGMYRTSRVGCIVFDDYRKDGG